MTPKERWLAALRLQPVDRLPFWPKLGAGYEKAQEAPFSNMEIDAIHDWIGSDKHIAIPGCVKEIRKTTSEEVSENGGLRRTVFKTELGSTQSVYKFSVNSQSWHPVEFPVKSLEDIKLMTEYFSDCMIDLDKESLREAKDKSKEIGADAITCNSIGTTGLMSWVQWLAGVTNGHYLLMDYEEEVRELFEVIHKSLVRKTEILCSNSPCDIIYLGENTSTTLISPRQYRKYCYRHIQEYARMVKDAGGLLILHMCGHLKALLPDLSTLPAAAFEAFTSPSVGDTTLLDGRTGCPDKCLIGGTNAISWTHPAKEIISEIKESLDQLPHHRGIVVTSAGQMPSLCKPETIKTVCDWVKAYPVRMGMNKGA